MDLGGNADGKLLMGDSNPGTVSIRPGGVGRNIACNLRLMGAEVSLITAFGGDTFAMELLKDCGKRGIDIGMSLVLPDMKSSMYLYVADRKGDMQMAVNDMGITDSISPKFLESRFERLNGFDAVVLDGNLPGESIKCVLDKCTVPVYADTVSAAKAGKFRGCAGKLRAVKPNKLEAEVLSGEDEPEKAAEALLSEGTGRVFISMGSEGMLAAEKGQMLKIPAQHMEDAVNTTGAGDAAAAAVVMADLQGLGLRETAELAVRAGAVTAAFSGTCSPDMADLFRK